MKHIYILVISILFSLSLQAQGDYHKEIEHLLNYVKTTKCTYIRNGEPYQGPKAVSHIQRKYNYFKDDIHSTEDFIRLSATKSTMSGRKYQIKCPGQPEMESKKWLLEELSRYRQHKTER